MTKNCTFALLCLAFVVSACEKTPTPPATTSTPSKENASAPATIDNATSSSTTTTVSSAPSAATIELVPKTSFGPIRLGMTKADIQALGILAVHPQYSGMTIPYTVYYDAAGKATRIQLTLKHAPADVSIGALTVPRTATFADAKSLLADCKDEPPAKGGSTSKCRGGAVNVSIGSGSPSEVWLEAAIP